MANHSTRSRPHTLARRVSYAREKVDDTKENEDEEGVD